MRAEKEKFRRNPEEISGYRTEIRRIPDRYQKNIIRIPERYQKNIIRIPDRYQKDIRGIPDRSRIFLSDSEQPDFRKIISCSGITRRNKRLSSAGG